MSNNSLKNLIRTYHTALKQYRFSCLLFLKLNFEINSKKEIKIQHEATNQKTPIIYYTQAWVQGWNSGNNWIALLVSFTHYQHKLDFKLKFKQTLGLDKKSESIRALNYFKISYSSHSHSNSGFWELESSLTDSNSTRFILEPNSNTNYTLHKYQTRLGLYTLYTLS